MRHVQGLAGASAAGDVAADDVTVATESDGPLFFFDAAGDGSSAGPDDSLPPSIGAIIDGKGSTDAVPMAEEEEEDSESPATRKSGRKRGPTKPSSKGSAKKRATKTKK